MAKPRMQMGLFILAEAAVAAEESAAERQVSRIIATRRGPGVAADATSGEQRNDGDRTEETISDRSKSPSESSLTASAGLSSDSQSHSATDVERDEDPVTQRARAQIKEELARLQELIPDAHSDFESVILSHSIVQPQSESQPPLEPLQSPISPISLNTPLPPHPAHSARPSRIRRLDGSSLAADGGLAKRKRQETEPEVADEIDYLPYQNGYRMSTRVAVKRTKIQPLPEPSSSRPSSQLPAESQTSATAKSKTKTRRRVENHRKVSPGDIALRDPQPDGATSQVDISAMKIDVVADLPTPARKGGPASVNEASPHSNLGNLVMDTRSSSPGISPPLTSDEVTPPSATAEAHGPSSIPVSQPFEIGNTGLTSSASLNAVATSYSQALPTSDEHKPRQRRAPRRYENFIANDLSSSAAASSPESESAPGSPYSGQKPGKEIATTEVDNQLVNAEMQDVHLSARPSTHHATNSIQDTSNSAAMEVDLSDRLTSGGKATSRPCIQPFIQFKGCMAGLPEGLWCTRCIGRRTGDTCRFIGLRWFPGHGSVENPYGEPTFIDDNREPTIVEYPTSWNSEMTQAHSQTLKIVLAEFLLPVLRAERARSSIPGLIVRNRELGFRVVCDFCMTGIFSAGWLCKCCGREFCPECYDHISKLSPTVHTEEGEARRRANPKSELRAEMRLMYCTKRHRMPGTEHTISNLVAVSRFKTDELDGAIQAMEAISAVANVLTQAEPMSEPAVVPQARRGPDDPPDPSKVGSHPFYTFTKEDLQESVFSTIWARGEAVVVTGLLDSFEIPWTPEWFTQAYGREACHVVDCLTEEATLTNVAKFFALFGQKHRKKNQLKLKDWPPTSDFSKAFPELFRDFSQAVPMPNYARRDGVLNIAAHYPLNSGAVVPDIGPKMYNALASSELPGGKGSTRLHMDMADAVNIMLFATPLEHGERLVQGTAVWDIYRAEDANKIRAFLVNKFGLKDKDTDPIHSQFYYLDAELREELRDAQGVISWRIYQKPGEAVFIPAGCAHQVCNLSDCIKVAVDFISPENISRCAKLTQEFRALNFQAKAWKEDVLELTQTLYHAWRSLSRPPLPP